MSDMSATDIIVQRVGRPYVIEAVRMLDDILQRMQGHQSKKRSMLRKLQLAANFSTSKV